MSDVECPFCGEKDFDLIGLKSHLQNFCDKYEETITASEDLERLRLVRPNPISPQQVTPIKGEGKI